MLCQNCKINDSTIHLYTNLNGKQKQIDLCQNCYKIIKTDPNNSLFKGMTDLNNRDFDPFGDFFNDLNNFRPSSNTPPIPPTQSGGGYGGNLKRNFEREGVVVAEVAYNYDEENGSVFTLRDVEARETYTFDSIDLIAMEIYELLY